MLSGCSTTAAAYLGQVLPDWDDGTNFLGWFTSWQDDTFKERTTTFQDIRMAKQTRLGITPAA